LFSSIAPAPNWAIAIRAWGGVCVYVNNGI